MSHLHVVIPSPAMISRNLFPSMFLTQLLPDSVTSQELSLTPSRHVFYNGMWVMSAGKCLCSDSDDRV